MLKDWQIKFPRSFERFPNLFINLDLEGQEALSQVLYFLEQTETGLLDEETVSHLFANSSYLSELIYLISFLSGLKCLNKPMLNYLVTNLSLPALQESMEILSAQTHITAEMAAFLFSTRNPQDCAAFMTRAFTNSVDLTVVLNFLAQHVALDGLSRAITLFDLSSYGYRKEHFLRFGALTKVLENPLCQTIFDARLRGFSDYTIISEPLSSIDADEIVKQLIDVIDEEAQIRLFFDFFAEFRPFPASQKYIVDVGEKVTAALMNYCESTIAAIASPQDCLQAQAMIATLRKEGGNKIIFDKIKYEIASEIESEDLCSMRTYDRLMDEIWLALNQPQVNLDTFADRFPKSLGYPNFFAEALRRQSLSADTNSMDMMDCEEKDKTNNLSL